MTCAAPFLTPIQLAFLSSLRAGARPASACHDALTVGTLMRSMLVRWNSAPARSAKPGRAACTFSLTPLGRERLRCHEDDGSSVQPMPVIAAQSTAS